MKYVALITRTILLLVLGTAAGLAIFATGLPGLIKPTSELLSQVLDLQTRVKRIQEENRYLQLVAANPQKYSSRIKHLRENLIKLQAVAPDAADPEAFTQSMTELARARGVRLQSVTPMKQVRREYYSEMPFAVKIEGPYSSLGKYLSALSNQLRRVRIEEFKVEIPAAVAKRGIKSNQSVIATGVVTAYFGLGGAANQTDSHEPPI